MSLGDSPIRQISSVYRSYLEKSSFVSGYSPLATKITDTLQANAFENSYDTGNVILEVTESNGKLFLSGSFSKEYSFDTLARILVSTVPKTTPAGIDGDD